MKSALITLLITLASLSCFSAAPTSNAMANFQKIGYDTLKASAIDSIKSDSLGQDENCPSSGTEIMDNISVTQSAMINITANVTAQTIAAFPFMKTLSAQQNRCGSCRQNNRVSYINYVRPLNVVADPSWDKRH